MENNEYYNSLVNEAGTKEFQFYPITCYELEVGPYKMSCSVALAKIGIWKNGEKVSETTVASNVDVPDAGRAALIERINADRPTR